MLTHSEIEVADRLLSQVGGRYQNYPFVGQKVLNEHQRKAMYYKCVEFDGCVMIELFKCSPCPFYDYVKEKLN